MTYLKANDWWAIQADHEWIDGWFTYLPSMAITRSDAIKKYVDFFGVERREYDRQRKKGQIRAHRVTIVTLP